LAKGEILEQPNRRRLPDAPDHLQIVLLLAIQVRDSLRTLISIMRARSDYLVACLEVHGERPKQWYMDYFGNQIRDSLAKCEASPCLPLMLYLGWSSEKYWVLHRIFENGLSPEDDVSDWGCHEARHWAYQLEQEVLKPVEELCRVVHERLARLPAATPAPDANDSVFFIEVNGHPPKVVFGNHSRKKEITLDYEVAVFLNEVYQANGNYVTCETIHAKHGVRLRVDRIIHKVPDDLRPCLVTKRGAGTCFDRDALTKLCQTLRID
jgi:hypothetical protein